MAQYWVRCEISLSVSVEAESEDEALEKAPAKPELVDASEWSSKDTEFTARHCRRGIGT
jgi:hypothetical protein